MALHISSRFVHRGLLAILWLGILGMSAELLLLVHYEDISQWIPLGLAVAALAGLTWASAAPGAASITLVKLVMLAFIAAGVAGVVLHFQANAEFQREIDPTIAGLDLFWKVVQAKAPPALAPGVMVQLGMVGWLYAALLDDSDT